MKQVFFLDYNAVLAHESAKELGFMRGEYVVIPRDNTNCLRGMRYFTLFVTGDAEKRDDYNDILDAVLYMRDATVIFIDAETLELLLTGETC